MTAQEKITVEFVGAGPVSLLLAAELGLRSVPTVVLTEGRGIATNPKANTHIARSMEIYRRHGLSDVFRAEGPFELYSIDTIQNGRADND